MKTRNGFVSNSSSSSFIVIDAKEGYNLNLRQQDILFIGKDGHTEFDWGVYDCTGIYDRINFSYLMYRYLVEVRAEGDIPDWHWSTKIEQSSSEWLVMLEEVIKENAKIEKISYHEIEYLYEDYLAYIDHQSVNEKNAKMFESKESLKDFIFGKGSYIHLDNDNH